MEGELSIFLIIVILFAGSIAITGCGNDGVELEELGLKEEQMEDEIELQ